ncbi:MAG: hypothetical protein NVS2B3_16270 [Vulcanimicrobiaceae bacterium]
MTSPATGTMPMSGPGGEPMDALKNNPNGPSWLDKFNRPGETSAPTGMKKKMKKM